MRLIKHFFQEYVLKYKINYHTKNLNLSVPYSLQGHFFQKMIVINAEFSYLI